MANNSYSIVSLFYKELMKDIDYALWTEYLLDILSDNNLKPNKILELAAGNGEISRILQKKGFDLISSDLSLEMLKNGNQEKKICFSFYQIPLKTKFDFIFATFDSFNYILQKKKFIHTLNEISNILDYNGIFTFDVSLESNSINNIELLNRKGNLSIGSYKQVSIYDSKKKIHTNKFEFITEGKKLIEIHKQRIFPFYDYFEMIERSELYIANCFQSFSFINANPNDERVQFILKKRKNAKI